MTRADVAGIIAVLLMWSAVGYAGWQMMQQEQAEESQAGYWMTIAAEDSVLQALDKSTLESTHDYGDSAYAEVHRLTKHYRVYYRGADRWLQVWMRP